MTSTLYLVTCSFISVVAIYLSYKLTFCVLCFQIPLNFFNGASSSTFSPMSCSDSICASIVQTASAECNSGSNQCAYSFKYGDGSGTSGLYVSDMLYFDTVMDASLIVNSSAPIVFG